MTTIPSHWLPAAEAARNADTELTYLHERIKAGKIRAAYAQKAKQKNWFVDPDCPGYQKLLNRNGPQPTTAAPPAIQAQFPIDWPLWEDMLRSGNKQVVKSRCAPKTIKEYRRYLERFLLDYRQLTRDTLRAAMQSYQETKDKDYTATKQWLFRAVMTLAKYFLYKGYVTPEFVHELRFLRPDKSMRTPKRPFHTAETVMKVLDTLPKAVNKQGKRAFSHLDETLNEVLIKLAFTTGMRSNEICSTRVGDIDYGKCKLRVRGKGGGGQVTRTIGISSTVRDALRSYWQERPESDSEYFLLHSKGKPLRPDYVYRRLKRVSKYAYVESFNPHSMRRSFTRWAVKDKKKDLGTVRDGLGHSTLVMTNIYLRTTEEDVVETWEDLSL